MITENFLETVRGNAIFTFVHTKLMFNVAAWHRLICYGVKFDVLHFVKVSRIF